MSGRQAAGAAQYALLVAAFLAVCGLVALQLGENEAKPDATTLGLAVLAAALLVGIGAPKATRKALAQVSRLKLGGVEVALREADTANRAQATLLSESEDGVPVKERQGTGDVRDDLLIVRERVGSRLDLCRHRVLGMPKGTQPDATLARLRAENLLTRDEAKAIGDVLGGVGETIEHWPADVAEAFLDSVWAFVSRLGSTAFDRKARRDLAAAGWLIADFEQGRGHRPDFLGYRDGRWHLLTARVVKSPDKARERLDGFVKKGYGKAIRDAGIEIDSTILAIPDSREPAQDGKYPEVEVRRLGSLLASSGTTTTK